MEKRELELYVHIPFCVKKCAYCDFLSAPAGEREIHAYTDALIREIRARGENHKDCRVSTVFLGGGTPSVLSGEDAARIFRALKESFDIAENPEITLEVNPGTVTEEKTAAWKNAGISRISIGLQSVNDRELKMLGRIHTFREFLNTWKLVRRAGFNNVSIDLISAIPGQTVQSWERTLRTVAELGPEHISAYSLIIEEGTPFYTLYGDGKENAGDSSFPPLPDEDEEREIYQRTASVLNEYGYHRYEISNYAREGYECRHNLGYWERKEYLGLGLGASSLIRECRFHNTADMEKYMHVYGSGGKAAEGEENSACSCMKTEEQNSTLEEIEKLSVEDQMEEFMFLGLRKTAGISPEDFRRSFDRNIMDVYGEKLIKLEKQGLIRNSGARISLTERGTDISNYVFSEFIF